MRDAQSPWEASLRFKTCVLVIGLSRKLNCGVTTTKNEENVGLLQVMKRFRCIGRYKSPQISQK